MDRYLFDPAELAWRDYLTSAQREQVEVVIPNTRPARFVQVDRVGGVSSRAHDFPIMTFTCWAPTRAAAAQLAADLQHVVLSAQALGDRHLKFVRTVTDPVHDPDPVSRSPRYRFTIRCGVRGRFPTLQTP